MDKTTYSGANWNDKEDGFTQDFLDMNQQNFWLPEEIALSPDLKVWNTLSDKVKDAYAKNLTILTFLDTWQGDMGMNIVGRSLPQRKHHAKALLSFMQSVENSIHARAYSVIFMTYLQTHEIDDLFIWGENQKQFQKIMDKIVSEYKNLEKLTWQHEYQGGVSEEELDIARYKAMVASVFLESALFYTGFYYPLWFGGQGKLTGASEMISLIVRDECLTEDAQVLTPTGWKSIKDVKKGDVVLEYDSTAGKTRFNRVLVTSKKYEDKTYSLSNKSGYYQRTSGGHRVVYLEDGKFTFSKMKDFEPSKDKKIIRAADFRNENNNVRTNLTLEERLKIAIQADGSIDSTKREDGTFKRDGSRTEAIPVKFNFAKKRKQERLVNLVEQLGYRCKIRETHKKGQIEYTVFVPVEVIGDLSKVKNPFYDYSLSDLTQEWCKEFMEELVLWDGHVRNDTLYYFGTTFKDMFDFAEGVAILTGYVVKTGAQTDPRKETYKKVYRLYLNKAEEKSLMTSKNTELKEEEGAWVYGVQVPSTNLVIKQRGSISVTGNCIHGMYVGLLADQILQSLPDEKQEELKEWVIGLLNELYELEVKVIEEIYDEVGLSHDVKIFLRYNFNKALMNLNLDTYFPEEEVNPVVLRGIDVGHKQIDYFSQKGDSYSKRKLEELLDEDFVFDSPAWDEIWEDGE